MKKFYFSLVIFAMMMVVTLQAQATINELSFDENGICLIPLTELTVTGGFTLDTETGVLSNDGTGGTVYINLPTEGIDMTSVVRIQFRKSGKDLFNTLYVANADGSKINEWQGSRYSADFSGKASKATAVNCIEWRGKENVADKLTINCVAIQIAAPEITDALLTDIFDEWSDATVSATKVKDATCTNDLFFSLNSGNLVYGDNAVKFNKYANLSEYEQLVATCTPGKSLRFLFNTPKETETEQIQLILPANEEGHIIINLKENELGNAGFVHLNAIKVPNGNAYSGVIVSKLQVYKKKKFTTGISQLSNNDMDGRENAPVYNIAGQKVNNYYKGIVIKNGKKFIIK